MKSVCHICLSPQSGQLVNNLLCSHFVSLSHSHPDHHLYLSTSTFLSQSNHIGTFATWHSHSNVSHVPLLKMLSSFLPSLTVLAQRMLQLRHLQNDSKHEELQRLRQKTILQCVSCPYPFSCLSLCLCFGCHRQVVQPTGQNH